MYILIASIWPPHLLSLPIKVYSFVHFPFPLSISLSLMSAEPATLDCEAYRTILETNSTERVNRLVIQEFVDTAKRCDTMCPSVKLESTFSLYIIKKWYKEYMKKDGGWRVDAQNCVLTFHFASVQSDRNEGEMCKYCETGVCDMVAPDEAELNTWERG